MHYLLDGYNLIFRSFYGIRELSRSDGFPTNAIHGWVKTLWYLQDRKDCDGMTVFLDSGADERESILPEYKKNRSETPEELEQQVPVIRELTALMGIDIIELPGVEADDLIASYAAQKASDVSKVCIVSADKDLAQCMVHEGVFQLLPAPTANPRLGWRLLDKEGVLNKFNVRAEQIADYLALVGDTADNIPGLQGVGPKTAAKWLNEYGDLETIIRKANYVAPARFQGLIASNAERLRQNLQLTRLVEDHPLEGIEKYEPQPEALKTKLLELEMKATSEQVMQRF